MVKTMRRNLPPSTIIYIYDILPEAIRNLEDIEGMTGCDSAREVCEKCVSYPLPFDQPLDRSYLFNGTYVSTLTARNALSALYLRARMSSRCSKKVISPLSPPKALRNSRGKYSSIVRLLTYPPPSKSTRLSEIGVPGISTHRFREELWPLRKVH
jgi:hypothetical protein